MFLPRHDQAFTLRDGRQLCYTVYGQPDGRPVLALEPFGFQLVGQFGQWSARATGVRVVTPYRPGFGHSATTTDDSLTRWADDMRQLLDGLNLATVDIVGIFSGSMAALTVAHELGDRIVSVALLNPAGPPAASIDTADELAKILARDRMTHTLRWKSKTRVVDQIIRLLAPSDRNILQDRACANLITELRQTFEHCASAARVEVASLSRPLPFELESMTTRVAIWHGTTDIFHPVSGATELAQRIPSSALTLLPNHGALWFINPTEGSAQLPPFD